MVLAIRDIGTLDSPQRNEANTFGSFRKVRHLVSLHLVVHSQIEIDTRDLFLVSCSHVLQKKLFSSTSNRCYNTIKRDFSLSFSVTDHNLFLSGKLRGVRRLAEMSPTKTQFWSIKETSLPFALQSWVQKQTEFECGTLLKWDMWRRALMAHTMTSLTHTWERGESWQFLLAISVLPHGFSRKLGCFWNGTNLKGSHSILSELTLRNSSGG